MFVPTCLYYYFYYYTIIVYTMLSKNMYDGYKEVIDKVSIKRPHLINVIPKWN